MKRKQLLSALLALSMVITLASCGSKPQNDTQQNTSQQDSTIQQSSQQDNSQKKNSTSEISTIQPQKTDTDPDHADTQPKIVFEKGGKTFFASKLFYYLTDGTNDAAVMVHSQNESPSEYSVSSKSLAFCGDEFYGVEHGSFNSIIWHVYADDTGTMHKEKLYTSAQVSETATKFCDKDIVNEELTHAAEAAFVDEVKDIIREDYKQQYEKPYEETEERPDDLPTYVEFKESHLQEYLDRYRSSLYQKHYDASEEHFWSYVMGKLCYDICDPVDGGDGYIYASLYLNRNRRLIRFAKDGSSYEVLNDIILSSFTISDGWLYYYDSGAQNADYYNNTTFDAKRRGIYKMRLDGSEKSKLYGNITLNIDEFNWYDEGDYREAVLKPRVVGDYLYYLLANKETRNYHLYRIPTEGGTPELCTPISCYNYTIDASGNTLCYYGCEEDLPLDYEILKDNKDKLKLVLKNLSDGTEKLIPNSQIVSYGYDDEMQIFDDTLYVTSNYFCEGKDIDISESGYEAAYTSKGEMVKIREPEYRINKYALAGLRINLTDGKAKWLLRYRYCKSDSDNFQTAIEEAKTPWQTVWKDADRMDDELNDIIKKYNIDVDYQEPPVY